MSNTLTHRKKENTMAEYTATNQDSSEINRAKSQSELLLAAQKQAALRALK